MAEKVKLPGLRYLKVDSEKYEALKKLMTEKKDEKQRHLRLLKK